MTLFNNYLLKTLLLLFHSFIICSTLYTSEDMKNSVMYALIGDNFSLLEKEHFLLSNEAEEDLEVHQESSLEITLAEFRAKGGTFVRLDPSQPAQSSFAILPHDIIYPVCSAGFCRSQNLWIILNEYRDKITLFPPHAARYGIDPFNGRLNWHRNEKENWVDEFELWAKEPKSVRFGYDKFASLLTTRTATEEELAQISAYYNAHYFGPTQNQSQNRRIYFCFDKNSHVTMFRLNQTNKNLEHVFVVHFPLKDLMTSPLPEWNTFPRSQLSYENFSKILKGLLDFSTF